MSREKPKALKSGLEGSLRQAGLEVRSKTILNIKAWGQETALAKLEKSLPEGIRLWRYLYYEELGYKKTNRRR